jgi:hypothetical protein
MTTKRYRPSMFKSGERDDNERHITAVLDRYHIRYVKMQPGAGFDILVMVNPLQVWEVKNPEYKWTLTKVEQAAKTYCRENGIPYRIIETTAQAVEAISERF